MIRSWTGMLSIVVIAVLVGTSLWLTVWARAQGEEGPAVEDTAQPSATANPVVAVIPCQSETEYEPDPFEPDRLRRSKTEVKRLLLIRADGTIEQKRAW